MLVTISILAVDGGFQGVVTYVGSTASWPCTDVLPSTDDVAQAIAQGIQSGLTWGQSQWGAGKWGV